MIGPFIQIFGHIVGCRPDHLHATAVCLMVGVCTLKSQQKAGEEEFISKTAQVQIKVALAKSRTQPFTAYIAASDKQRAGRRRYVRRIL
jgi:hypothetical protein